MNRPVGYHLSLLSFVLILGFQNCSKVSFLHNNEDSAATPQDTRVAHVQSGGNNPADPSGGGLDPTCLVSKGCDPIAKVVTLNCKDEKYIDWPNTKTDVYPKLTTDFSYSFGGSDLGTFESMTNVVSISSSGGILQARSIQAIRSISAPTDINATSIGSMSVSAHVCLHNLESIGNISLSGATYILGAGKLSIGSLFKISNELLISDASVDQIDMVSAPIYLRGVTLNKLTNCTAAVFIENTSIQSMDATCTVRVTQLP